MRLCSLNAALKLRMKEGVMKPTDAELLDVLSTFRATGRYTQAVERLRRLFDGKPPEQVRLFLGRERMRLDIATQIMAGLRANPSCSPGSDRRDVLVETAFNDADALIKTSQKETDE